MSEALQRRHKMQVLLRLREVREEAAAAAWQAAAAAARQAQQRAEREARGYDAACRAASGRQDPALHTWRLAAVAEAHGRALATARDHAAAEQAARGTQQALTRCRLDTRVGEEALARAETALRDERAQTEREEAMELQLLWRGRAP